MKPNQRHKPAPSFKLSDWGIDPSEPTWCPKCHTNGLTVAPDKKSWDCSNCHWNWNLSRQTGEKMIYDSQEIAPEIMRWHEHGVPLGSSLGWPDLDKFIRFRRGEMTVVTGWSSHGKSQLVDAIMVNMAGASGWKFGLFSPENVPYAQHIKGILQKMSGKRFRADGAWTDPVFSRNVMDRDEVLLGMAWMKEHFFFVDTPEPTFDQLLAQFWKLVKTQSIQCVIIDPWNEIEHDIPFGMNETQYVAKVLIRFRDFCKGAHVHGIIVAHPSKGALDKKKMKIKDGQTVEDRPVVGLLDISGSAHFENKTFNGISVWRNPADEADKHSNHIYILKHRTEGVGGVGKIVLTWDPLSTMYHSPDKPLINGRFVIDQLKAKLDKLAGVTEGWRPWARRMEKNWFLRIRPLPWMPMDQSHFEQEYEVKTDDAMAGVWLDSDGRQKTWWAQITWQDNQEAITTEHDTMDLAMEHCETKLMKGA